MGFIELRRWKISVLSIVLLNSLIVDEVNCENHTLCTTCVKIGETHCFNRSEVLKLEADFRAQVVIHKIGVLRSQNTLYFVYEPKISDPEYSKIGFVNLDNPASKGIITPPESYLFNFGAFDIDQAHETIYLGGSNGIFLFDTKTRKTNQLVAQNDTVLDLCYFKDIYFIRENENKIVKKEHDRIIPYLQFGVVKNFIITEKGVIVMLTTNGLYVYKANEIEIISKNSYFRGITLDLDNNVFVWWVDGIYEVIIEDNIHKSKLIKVLDVSGIGGLAFDNDNNILFTSEAYLLRYSKTNLTECDLIS